MIPTAHKFHDPKLAEMAEIARRYDLQLRTAVPLGTGVAGTGPVPASLAASPISATPASQPTNAIPFTRASTLAVMQDSLINAMVAGQPVEVNLQANGYLAAIILNVAIVAVNTGAPATVKWNNDGPFAVFGLSGIALNDSANLPIILPISGAKLNSLNKLLPDTDCNFDPARDAGFYMLPTAANNGTGSTATNAGSANFRLVIPVEIRRRDALGCLTNQAANEPIRLTLTPVASYLAGADQQNNLYATAPFVSTTVNIQIFQCFWTQPPAVIVSGSTSTPTIGTPAGLGTVAFIRSELHKEVNGGGDSPFQLTSVGDIIANIIFTLRTSINNQRDQYTLGGVAGAFNTAYPNWPPIFHWYVNDFNTLSLSQDIWVREMARFFNLTNGVSNIMGNGGYLDGGVFTLGPWFEGMFDRAANYAQLNQLLATESGTKLRSTGNVWGAGSANCAVDVRVYKTTSGAALYS